MEKNTERMDVGVTRALRAYPDKYGYIKAMGLTSTGHPDWLYPDSNEVRNFAKEDFEKSVDIADLGLEQDQGSLLQDGVKLTPKFENGELITVEGIKCNKAITEACYRAVGKKA